jgi:hypothetical protein
MHYPPYRQILLYRGQLHLDLPPRVVEQDQSVTWTHSQNTGDLVGLRATDFCPIPL